MVPDVIAASPAAAYVDTDPVPSLDGVEKSLATDGAAVFVGEVVADCGVGGAYAGGVSCD